MLERKWQSWWTGCKDCFQDFCPNQYLFFCPSKIFSNRCSTENQPGARWTAVDQLIALLGGDEGSGDQNNNEEDQEEDDDEHVEEDEEEGEDEDDDIEESTRNEREYIDDDKEEDDK